jgi:(E)-4-hydroxy-3-methylbut-2-enyl-diphosphate synthase
MFGAGASRDEIILTCGTEIGALMVDGLGDGVLVDCPTEDLDFLRTMSFGLLQVCVLLNRMCVFCLCVYVPACGRARMACECMFMNTIGIVF